MKNTKPPHLLAQTESLRPNSASFQDTNTKSNFMYNLLSQYPFHTRTRMHITPFRTGTSLYLRCARGPSRAPSLWFMLHKQQGYALALASSHLPCWLMVSLQPDENKSPGN